MTKKDIKQLKSFKDNFEKDALKNGFGPKQSKFLANFFAVYMATSTLQVDAINELKNVMQELLQDLVDEEEEFCTCGE